MRFEYFIDTDPGIGLGTQVSVTPSVSVTNFSLPISTTSLPSGFHTVYIRSQNDLNQWTHTHFRSLYIVPAFPSPNNITQIEYFVDTDPGVGLATQVTGITPSTLITNLPVDITASTFTPGFHTLYLRSKNSLGEWSQTHFRSFYIANLPSIDNLVKFEYFFDTDPGFDNGIASPVAPPVSTVTNKDIFAVPSSLSLGSHTIYIRAKDSSGDWTQVSTGSFIVTSPLPPTITSFTPSSGLIGTTVTITGTNFDPSPANNTVKFNGTTATVTASTSTSITTTVPTGATTGIISITTGGNTATSSTSFTVTSCVPASERAALVALYTSGNGANWGDFYNNPIYPTNWLTADESTWYGVTVTGCHVTRLDVETRYIKGTLPIELKDLTELDSLVITQGYFDTPGAIGGPIPKELGQLTKLKNLLLWGQFSGTIPKEIGNLTKLKRLDLIGHDLTGNIPAELGNLVNLEILMLQGGYYISDALSGTSGLTGTIPVEIAALPKLRQISLRENQLTGVIPDFISPSLLGLDIGGNQLTGSVPSSVGNLVNLLFLGLYRNQLGGPLPASLNNIVNIPQINLRNNQFTGAFPASFGASAKFVRITNNKFSSIPAFTNAGLFQLSVENNSLDFGSLEPNKGKPGFAYAPQGNLPGGNVLASVGSLLTIPFSTGGTQNSYQWYKNSVLIPGANTMQYSIPSASLADAGNYTVTVTNTLITGLTLTSNPFVVTVTTCPTDPAPVPNSGCQNSAIKLSASGGANGQYRWYTTPTGGTAIAGSINSTFTTPTLTTTTSYFVSITDGTCESSRKEVIATVLPLPTAPIITSSKTSINGVVLLCSENIESTTLATSPAGFASYAWSNGQTVPSFSTSQSGSITVRVTDGNGCQSVASTSLTINSTSCKPTIATATFNTPTGGTISQSILSLITVVGTLNPASLKIITQPASGALASIGANGILVVNYSGLQFIGTESVTIEACDTNGICATQTITIKVDGDIVVFNAISPNGDDKNPIFTIQNINLLPETKNNKVSVYNRWGDVVFETENYDNINSVFRGLNNSGDALPSGTYYYKIKFASGLSEKTGFIALRK